MIWRTGDSWLRTNPPEVAIYINGELDSKHRPILVSKLMLGPGKLGAHNWKGTVMRHLSGTMDDLRVYNRAISADEIKTLYNWRGKKSPPAATGELRKTSKRSAP